MKKLSIAARAIVLVGVVVLAAAWVRSFVHPGIDFVTGARGSYYNAFYDFHNGWYSGQVTVALLVLIGVTMLVLPRPGRRKDKN